MRDYVDASLRGTLPVDPISGQQGVCFDLADGSVVRLRLDWQSAQALSDWISDHWDDYRGRRDSGVLSQSSGSSGSSHSDGSPQDGQKVDPPKSSSKAGIGYA